MKLSQHKVMIFGGTGSLGRTLIKRLKHQVRSLHVFSRDEAKHHYVKLDHPEVHGIIGDIRDYDSVKRSLKMYAPTIVINAAAMKQVPACEFYPLEAIKTNTLGAQNLVKAIHQVYPNGGVTALSISTDKACKPVNSYGMTKALQERIHLNGNSTYSVFNCVRYGNVLESTGSVIPVYRKILKEGVDPLLVTNPKMTRFFMSLDQSVDLILRALKDDEGGKIFIPKVKSAKIIDLAHIMAHAAGNPSYPVEVSGIRPGEKLDEILISEEEVWRTEELDDVFVVHDIKKTYGGEQVFFDEYSSAQDLMSYDELQRFLTERGVL